MAESSSQFFIFFFFLFLSVLHIATSIKTCNKVRHLRGPLVRFPFRFRGQHQRCGYPGFNLSHSGNDTIIQLPKSSGKFIVQDINYKSQTILINDHNRCLPRRFLDSFNLSESPFKPLGSVDFNFFNCSSDYQPSDVVLRHVPCLSGKNFTVVAVPVHDKNESRGLCSLISKVSAPTLWWSGSNLQEGVTLRWQEPACFSCEARRGICGFKNYDSQNLSIGCDLPGSAVEIKGQNCELDRWGVFFRRKMLATSQTLFCTVLPRAMFFTVTFVGFVWRPLAGWGYSHCLPRTAKYGIIVGVAIPGLLCFIGLVCYTCGKIRACYDHYLGYDFTTSITPYPQSSVLLTGLDGSIIDSFPKILLGESGRLPKPNDNTCPICLSEYQPKETLRTIPECNHYFHTDCIDEWLKMNATCPLCRNSPDGSDVMTPSSSPSSLQ